MNPLVNPLPKLIDTTQLVEKKTPFDANLKELAYLTTKVLKTQQCLVLLLSDREATDISDSHLKVVADYSNLSDWDYSEQISLNKRVACHVITHNQPLLIEDIRFSPLAIENQYLDVPAQSLISAPIMDDSVVVGAINVSFPDKDKILSEDDLQLLEILAGFVSKSLQTTQLQMILKSKFIEQAVRRDLQEQEISEYAVINPNPNKLAKIVAKSFFRELTQVGFGPNEVINIATEVLSLLNESLEKHRQRLAREDQD